jgi:signal transduction histidine kinase
MDLAAAGRGAQPPPTPFARGRPLRLRLPTIAFAAAVLVLLLVLAGYFATVRRLESLQADLLRSAEVGVELERLLSSVKDLETGQRGYILTGNASYLEAYDEGLAALPRRQAALRALLAGDAAQLKRLDQLEPLVTGRVAEIVAALRIFETRGQAAALEAIAGDRGRPLMDGLRAMTARLIDAQEITARTQRERVEQQTLRVNIVSIGAGLFSAAALAVVLVWLTREIGRRRAAEAVLAELNAALERRVAERTAALERTTQELATEIREHAHAEDERRRLERELAQAQRLQAIGQLTGGIAHDFNNLLTVILGSAELLDDNLPAGNADLRAAAQRVGQAAQRGAALTQHLLAFARRQPLRPAIVQVNDAVAETLDLLRRTLGDSIVVETRPHASLWPALVDAAQLENVILNLALNARDAMPGGGRLTIATDNVTLSPAAAAAAEVAPGDYVVLAVSDTGVGMTPEVAARAFEPFFTTKPVGKGTGLGLSTVYGFVKQSGGHVALDSAPGRGTTVRLTLPRAAAGASEQPRPEGLPAAV